MLINKLEVMKRNQKTWEQLRQRNVLSASI